MSRPTTCTVEQRLALALIGTCARREAGYSRIVELASWTDFRTLEVLLRTQGMLSLIGQRLLELVDGAPDDFVQQVQACCQEAQRHGIYQQMITIRLTAALAEAGIRSLPLKGPLLAERIHGGLATRVSADIDLLVAETDLIAAVDVLTKLGYRRAPRAEPPHLSRPDLHECLRSTADLPEVELHWRVHHYERGFSAKMLQRALPGPEGCLCPTAPDELIALLLFYARDGLVGLRLLADLTGWWDYFGSTLAPGQADELVREHPTIISAVATAALTARCLGGLPAEELFASAILSSASHRAMRLSNWCVRGRRSEIAANLLMIDCLLCPRAQWRALGRRHLWHDEAALVDAWSDTGLTRSALMRARVLHLIRLSGRCLIALWQLRRGGEWAPVPGIVPSEGPK
jgi:Uncharacterised nucleotidyltransferase